MSAADALVARLPPNTLVVGKGGVGKTTCAAALALHASRTTKTLVLSTDPARALPSVLDHPLETSPTAIPYATGGRGALAAQMFDTGALRARFMERWGDVIRAILDRGTYLDASDIDPLVDTALPGSDEIFAALELARLLAEGGDRRLFIDTAPTGHTLRLLNLPRTFRALIRLLDAMQAKHRFMVRTLTRAYRADTADAFLEEMTALVTTLENTLTDPARCAAVVVTNTQPMVVDETRRYLDALQELRIQVGAVVWNGVDTPVEPLAGIEQYTVPRLRRWPVGRDGLEGWLRELRKHRRGAARRARPTRPAPVARGAVATAAEVARLLRPLTIVAGKGGVGKTSVAAALALRSAEEKRTLVVSTDPSPSLADALRQNVPDSDTPVGGAPRLRARQMDASAAFARLRAEYETRVDALFEGLIARGVDLAHDRAIARDLLSLAPPGIDEVYALSLLADALFENNYERVIVDPAPTGHLLRLLEMPQLALTWSHQLLRLMLKYREVTGLGDAARDLLAFARNLRTLDALLQDDARSALVLVTLDEPVVRSETKRLAHEVTRRRVAISGVVLNRGRVGETEPLPVVEGCMHFVAPSVEPPPVGRDALGRWLNSWHAATMAHDAR